MIKKIQLSKKQWDYHYKIILIGDGNVGKSSVTKRFTENKFENFYNMTIGFDCAAKSMKLDVKEIYFQIWDTAGQERFQARTSSFYRDSKAIILVYDITNSESFDHIERWMRNIDDVHDDVEIIIVGNKCDKIDERIISKDRGENIAKFYNIPFLETSAKENININETFITLARILIEKELKKRQIVRPLLSIQVQKDSNEEKYLSCCW